MKIQRLKDETLYYSLITSGKCFWNPKKISKNKFFSILNSLETTLQNVIDKYNNYVVWHEYKYSTNLFPNNKNFISRDNQLKSIETFFSECMFRNEYIIEIKHQEREPYLFGENISDLFNKHKKFNDKMLIY